jgi:transglutaminase/protease-like cytokinesis protein 3
MNYLKSTFLIFFFLISPAFAGIKILEWEEESKLTNSGRNSKFLIKIQAVNLSSNQVIDSFSINSSEKKRLMTSRVKVNAFSARSLSLPGSFEVFFDKPIKNNESIFIEYEAKNEYDKINKYIRQEPFYIPEFATGAMAKVSLDFSENSELSSSQELISSYKNLNIENKKIIFKGIVPNKGVKEIIRMTDSSKTWDVSIKSKIILNNSEGELEITAPYLFRGGAQEVKKQTISANKVPKKHITNRDNDVLTFDIKPLDKEIIVQNKAIITTGKKYAVENNRQIEKFLEVSEGEKILLQPILQKIIVDPEFDFMPLHAKIVGYVNKTLKYDLSYFGKLLTVEQILQTKSGVCSEFATLFNALARVAKIPSSIVHGYAFGDYDKFESHAWNMIFVDNKWIFVDPTWNLSSGAVSSSHIYIKDNRKEELLLQFKGKGTDIKIERDFEIKEL